VPGALPATIPDVAAAAGASTHDVALVVAADPRVAPKLRHRILEAIESCRYRPFEAVQAKLGRPLRIATILKDYQQENPEQNRFYHPVAGAIFRSCEAMAAEIVPSSMVADDQCDLLELPPELTSGNCDAAFIVGGQISAPMLERLAAVVPTVVLVDGYSDGSVLDSVVSDGVTGARAAVDHLVSVGHREIALIGTEPTCFPSMLDRRRGYAEAIAAHRLPAHFVDTSYVLTSAVAVLGVAYLRTHSEVTAVLGANDVTAISLMQAARDHGFRFPSDLSVVGFDDIDLAGLSMPALTTVAIDRTFMGRAGVALMAHRLDVPDAEVLKAVVVPRLVERETVAPPRARQVGMPE